MKRDPKTPTFKSATEAKDVDWSVIQTPAGMATKAPHHLHALESPDPKVRAKGFAALRKLAIYEGDVTDAAVPLAPKLVALAGGGAPGVAETLRLLGDLLVCGSADLWLKIGYDMRIPAFEDADPEQYGRALYEIIARGTSTYMALLDHADALVRAHTAPLLAYLSRESEAIEPALLAHVEAEQDPAAQASLALALAHQGRYREDPAATQLLKLLAERPDPLVRACAAAGLAVTLGADAPPSVGPTLVATAKQQRKRVAAIPWYGGVLANMAVVVCAHLCKCRGDLKLAEALVASSAKLPTHFWAYGALLDAAFANDPRPTPWAPGELDPGQEQAVLQVAGSGEVERLRVGLERLGLPADSKALLALVGEGSPTALARVVSDQPLLRLAARALRTAAAQAAWQQAQEGMTDAERVAIARDAHCHALRICSLPRPSGLDPHTEEFLVDDDDERALLERAIALSTLDLIPCSVASLAQALEELAAQKLQPPGYAAPLAYATCEAAFRAGEVVPELVDARLARINPGSTSGCVADLRRALGRLPPERREAVVLKHHFWHAEREGGVVVGGGWLTADLCPTTAVATAVVGEIQSWSGGSAPYPEAEAAALLRQLGAVARPAVEAALKGSPKYAAVLEAALR